MKKIKRNRLLPEVMNGGRFVRVVMHGNDSDSLYLLDKRRDLHKKRKHGNVFTVNHRDYVFQEDMIRSCAGGRVLHYHVESCLPFAFEAVKSNGNAERVFQFAASDALHKVHDWHFFENVFSDRHPQILTLFTILAFVGGSVMGYLMGGG